MHLLELLEHGVNRLHLLLSVKLGSPHMLVNRHHPRERELWLRHLLLVGQGLHELILKHVQLLLILLRKILEHHCCKCWVCSK